MQETFLTAIGRAAKAKAGTGSVKLVDGLPPFLAADNLKPFIPDELRESTTPIVFRTPKGNRAFGYDALLLPKVIHVYTDASIAGALRQTQDHAAARPDGSRRPALCIFRSPPQRSTTTERLTREAADGWRCVGAANHSGTGCYAGMTIILERVKA